LANAAVVEPAISAAAVTIERIFFIVLVLVFALSSR